jgi:hypothetical protein
MESKNLSKISVIIFLGGCLYSCDAKRASHENKKLEVKSSLLGIKVFSDVRELKYLRQMPHSEFTDWKAARSYYVVSDGSAYKYIGEIPLEEINVDFSDSFLKPDTKIVPNLRVRAVNHAVQSIELTTWYADKLSAALRETYGEPDSIVQEENSPKQEIWTSKSLMLNATYENDTRKSLKLSLESLSFKQLLRKYEDSVDVAERKKSAQKL